MSVAAVHKGVPLPSPVRGARIKWPWADMKVGDMFFIPERDRNTMATLAWSTGKKLGRKFSTRLCWMRHTRDDGWVLAEEGERRAVLGIGVWREA